MAEKQNETIVGTPTTRLHPSPHEILMVHKHTDCQETPECPDWPLNLGLFYHPGPQRRGSLLQQKASGNDSRKGCQET
jgi:hypothetical protein